jgi:transketolase
MAVDRSQLIPALHNIATRLRIDSARSTSEAASGHPTSCFSAADLVAALFFAEMRFDPKNPQHPGSDRFILSKGHAAPVLYAAWAEAGAFDRSELLKLRRIDSDLEGHPTPRLPFVDVATGSLGQGICAAIGCALNARRIKSDYRTYCLIGDGESAEGSVWEAAEVAAHDRLDTLCGITDVNALGQSSPTMWRHDVEQLARQWIAYGWHAIVVDGHDLNAILAAYAEARSTSGKPTMIVARTLKGKGVSFVEGKDGWHGKPFKKGEELDRALAELEQQFVSGAALDLAAQIPKPSSMPAPPPPISIWRRKSRSHRRCRRPRRRRNRSRRRPTRRASWSRPARRTAPRSPCWAKPTSGWSRSMRTSRTRPSATASRKWRPTASIRTSSPSR